MVMELRVGGRVITTTGEHPFHVEGRGWVEAAFLRPGDLLSSNDGTAHAVEAVGETRKVVSVNNVQVEEFHTYFVGCQQWGFSVWAHNADCHVIEYLKSIGITDQKTIDAVLAAKGNPGRVAAELLGHEKLRTTDAWKAAARNVVEQAKLPAPATLKGLTGHTGLSYDTKHLQKHLPDTPEAAKLIKKEGAAHVFNDEATLRRVEAEILARGANTGAVRGAERYGLRFDEPIGYRIDAAGKKIPLHYGELKLDPATGKYHVIPRTGPSK